MLDAGLENVNEIGLCFCFRSLLWVESTEEARWLES